DEWESDAWIYANYYVYREIAARERKEILELLSEKYEVKFFTQETDLGWRNVIPAGEVDYERQMTLVFQCSKINLNISLRSIKTGIPLRVWDIMGCGGFVLTNYQEELLDYFVPNEDFVYYENYEDLQEKAEYYLTHDAEREKIARNAYEKVKRFHTYADRIREILQIVENERELKIYDLIERIQQSRKGQGGEAWYRQFILRERLTKAELVQNTEAVYQKMEAEKDLVFELKNIMLEEFNRLLDEGNKTAYETILRWMRTQVINEFCVFFSEFDYMAIFCDIYQMECLKGKELTFSHCQSVNELIELFQSLGLFMRRIERDAPEEEQEELLYYVIQHKVSDIAFVQILEASKIYNKQKVLVKMEQWMEEWNERG
ncbi:MAG: glycosyltransferase family 1 protein, partial [Eubacterium sp.]|nr:glycosyltransferase family 1 protein [Eubacterium sp.]